MLVDLIILGGFVGVQINLTFSLYAIAKCTFL